MDNIIASVSQTGISAWIVQGLVQDMKKSGWLKSSSAIITASLVLNFMVCLVVSLGEAISTGKPLSWPFIEATIGTVASAVYHDWRNTPNTLTLPVTSVPVLNPILSKAVETTPTSDLVVGEGK